MRNNSLIWLQCIAVVAVAAMFAGCPSSKRIVVEGYDDAMLSRKRIMLLVPSGADVKLVQPDGKAPNAVDSKSCV